MNSSQQVQVLVNSANVTAAGPRALVLSLLPALVRAAPEWQFTLLLPDDVAFRALALPANTQTVFVKISYGISNDLSRLKQLFWDIPRLAHYCQADVCLTLGDLAPIRLPCPQVVFLHLLLLVYSESELGGLSWPLLKRLYLTQHFAWTSRQAAFIVVQTPVMAERLARCYGVERQRIVEIAQPVPQHVTFGLGENGLHPQISACDKPIRLLFLAAYYPHKNHAILPAVARELRYRQMTDQVHIFVTLDEKQSASSELRRRLREYPDVITNLGSLPPTEVAGALCASTALFLPTLAESYGLVYLEAMACGLPILTSDRDFARWMCRDLALYLDPCNPSSIVDTIQDLPSSIELSTYKHAASQRLDDFPKNWDEVARMFVAVLRQSLRRDA